MSDEADQEKHFPKSETAGSCVTDPQEPGGSEIIRAAAALRLLPPSPEDSPRPWPRFPCYEPLQDPRDRNSLPSAVSKLPVWPVLSYRIAAGPTKLLPDFVS